MKFPYKVNVCYIINKDGQILLQKKRRGFGRGKWNGPGGKIELGETPEESVIREVEEETGLKIKRVKKAGELEFIFPDKNINNYCHAFICDDFEGKPEDNGEGELKWFDKKELPFDKMWDDDKYWLPKVLIGEYVNMRFNFNEEGGVINFINLKI